MNSEQKTVIGTHAGRAAHEILQRVCGPWLAAEERRRMREEFRSTIHFEMERLALALEKGT